MLGLPKQAMTKHVQCELNLKREKNMQKEKKKVSSNCAETGGGGGGVF